MPAFTLAGSPPFSGGKVTIDSVGANKRITGPVSLLDVNQGAIGMRWRKRWAGGGAEPGHRFFSWRDGSINALELYYEAGSIIFASAAAGAVLSAPITDSSAAETDHTLVAYWTPTAIGLSIDGSAFSMNARGTIPTIAGTVFDIGRYSPSAVQWADADLFWMVLLSSVPTRADSQALHAFGNSDPTWSQIPGIPTLLWPCDDANYLTADPGPSGILTDLSGNGNTAAINGSVPLAAGLFDASTGSRNFPTPNVSNYLTVADSASLDLGDVFSIETWISPASFATSNEERVVLTKGTGAYQLALLPDGRLAARKHGTGTFVVSRNPIALNSVYQVVVTKSGNDARLYVNGVDVTGTVTAGIVCVDNSSPLYIGRNDTATGPWHGRIDDTVLYATVLSPERVLAHYLAANPAGAQPEPDPVIPLSIPGALGAMKISFNASRQAIGPGRLGDPSDNGPVNPWESRDDSVTHGTYNANEDTTIGTWSIRATPAGNALHADLPAALTAKRRVDLQNGKNTGGGPITTYTFGNAWNFTMGEEIWLCGAFELPLNWVEFLAGRTIQDFFLIEQTGSFPTGNQPGHYVHGKPDRVTLALNAGFMNAGGVSVIADRQDLVPVGRLALSPAIHEYVRLWKPAVDGTGLWQAWHRLRGEAKWTRTVNYAGPTVPWSSSGGPNPVLTGRDAIDAYTRGGSVPLSGFYHHKYARATGPGVLEQLLNS